MAVSLPTDPEVKVADFPYTKPEVNVVYATFSNMVNR